MERIVAATGAGVWCDGSVTLHADVRCLALAGSTLWAGTDGDGVHRSDDGGATWVPAGLAGARIRSLAADEARLYAGTKPARVFALVDDWRPLARFPRLRSWFWATPAEAPFREPAVYGIVAAGEVVLAGIEAGAVVRSADGGRSWSGHRRGASRDCHGIVLHGGTAYAVGGTRPLTVSRDLGETWTWPRAGLHGRYGWSAAADGGDVYLGAGQLRNAHRPGERGWVYRGDGFGSWTALRGPLDGLPRIAAAGGVVVHSLGDELHRSDDRGETWQRVEARLPAPARALALLRPTS